MPTSFPRFFTVEDLLEKEKQEIQDKLDKVIGMLTSCVAVMLMQENREKELFHIPQDVALTIWEASLVPPIKFLVEHSKCGPHCFTPDGFTMINPYHNHTEFWKDPRVKLDSEG